MNSAEELTIKRRNKKNKTRFLVGRLTEEEWFLLNELREKLQFENLRDLVVFGNEVLKNLARWEESGYKFYLKGSSPEDIREIDFQLFPNKNKEKDGKDPLGNYIDKSIENLEAILETETDEDLIRKAKAQLEAFESIKEVYEESEAGND